MVAASRELAAAHALFVAVALLQRLGSLASSSSSDFSVAWLATVNLDVRTMEADKQISTSLMHKHSVCLQVVGRVFVSPQSLAPVTLIEYPPGISGKMVRRAR